MRNARIVGIEHKLLDLQFDRGHLPPLPQKGESYPRDSQQESTAAMLAFMGGER